jgi:phosphate transport system substrate-binding protein
MIRIGVCDVTQLTRLGCVQQGEAMNFRQRVRAIGFSVLVGLSGAAHADLKIAGSDTLEAFMQNALSQFRRSDGASIPVTASFKGSSAGLRDLCEGRAAIVPSSSRIDSENQRRCDTTKTGYMELPIAFDAIVVIANPARAALGELNLDELKAIFHPDSAGKVMRWRQVRASLADTPLNVVSLDPKSGTNAFFGSKVHGLAGFVRSDAKVSSQHADIIRMVAADPNAIGFVSLGALADSRADVWKVPINFGNGPVVPSRDAVLNDSYAPLSRLMYLYVSKAALAEKDGHTLQFVAWLMERAGRLASYEGFVRLTDANYQDNLRKLPARNSTKP